MRPRLDCRGEPAASSARPSCASATSMRPRLDCRGEPRGRRRWGSTTYNFNAATARLPWRSPATCHSRRVSTNFNAATARLPWRISSLPITPPPMRNFNAATARLPWRSAIVCGCDGHRFTSMRPRLDCRGEPFPGNVRYSFRDTSMRPRLDCRGEALSGCLVSLASPRLQCGHGSIAVEKIKRNTKRAWPS